MNLLSPPLIAELLALGHFAGFLAGLLGIGGGRLRVPFLTLILSHRGVPADVAVKMPIATSMTTRAFISLSSVRAHHRRGAVLWPLVRGHAPGIALGSLLASAGAFAMLKGQVLAFVVVTFLSLSATTLRRGRKSHPSHQAPGWKGQTAAGTAVGFMSGLVGAGGGFVSVPIMTRWNVASHNAAATSAALGFPIALANTLGHGMGGWSLPSARPGAFGFWYLPAGVVIASASVVMAPVGARAAHRLDVSQLKMALAALLYGLAACMLWKALAG